MRLARILLLILAFMSPMLLGVSCQTDFRDAVVGGAIDYVSGTTTSLLQQWVFPGVLGTE
jgi:hypothetical protein